MSPFKSSAGRALGKMLEGFKSSDIGKGFGSGGGSTGPFTATGGEKIYAPDGNTYHVFKHPGNNSDGASAPFFFEASGSPGVIEFLLVGAGGGGGWDVGGGGGGGGVVVNNPVATWTIDAGSYAVTVGQGGAGGNGPTPNELKRGVNGGSSTLTLPTVGQITALGGGGGGGWHPGGPSINSGGTGGANGGGHCGWNASGSGSTGVQPSQNPGITGVLQYGGYQGGSNPVSSPSSGGGGGAGAGANGGTGGQPNVGGAGGSGKTIPAFACTPSTYAPALPSGSVTVIGSPGNFGPGAAGISQDGSTPVGVGADFTGAGGGAGGNPNQADRGGHGIVIIRYTTT